MEEKKWKKCQQCDFSHDRSLNDWFCSIKCEEEWYEKLYGRELCKLCGKGFVRYTKTQVFCCQECRLEFYRQFDPLFDKSTITRFKIFVRDNFTCRYCGRFVLDHPIILEIDHIYPKSKDGKNSVDNYITSCRDCNVGKRDIILSKIMINKLKNREDIIDEN